MSIEVIGVIATGDSRYVVRFRSLAGEGAGQWRYELPPKIRIPAASLQVTPIGW